MGVTDYLDGSLKLKHAAADAEAVAKGLKERANLLFHERLNVKTLVALTIRRISFPQVPMQDTPGLTFCRRHAAERGQISAECNVDKFKGCFKRPGPQ